MATTKVPKTFAVHMAVPEPAQVPLLERFITDAMPRLGLDTLVLEADYRYRCYRFGSHPDLADPDAIGRGEARRIVAAAKKAGIRIVPLFNCLGHQSWKKDTFALLAKHPEFDEYADVDTDDPDFYCRSWCPLAPGLHEVVFDLIDEIADDFEAKDFHCGMDEVFIIADEHCPRCKGKNPAELFAGEVKVLHDHLTGRGVKMWIWGDRLLDAKATGLSKWDASENGTAPAIDMIPTDVVICDWHYEESPPTAQIFAKKGFPVLSCPYDKSEVALEHLEKQRALAASADADAASGALGILQTVWTGQDSFMCSCLGESLEKSEENDKGLGAADSLRALSKAMGRWRCK
ncbi:MAG: family 20 glycosylhydrolase [Planctomycetes bacterium]|nr:family 20 glycosylhydrolase [Planctomycetota bacterium]